MRNQASEAASGCIGVTSIGLFFRLPTRPLLFVTTSDADKPLSPSAPTSDAMSA